MAFTTILYEGFTIFPNSEPLKNERTCCRALRWIFFLNGDQFFFFLEKLRRDIELILFASWTSENLCCNKIFSASGHVRWRYCYTRFMYLLIYMDRIWEWRHRTRPEAGKISMQHKFSELHDAKRIRSISCLSFSRKKKNWSPFIQKSTLGRSRNSISDSFYVGSDQFRHWFQK